MTLLNFLGEIDKRDLPIWLGKFDEGLKYEEFEGNWRNNLERTEREARSMIRIGQDRFRYNLFSLWRNCAVTNTPEKELLRASHIKPWRDCYSDEERLDPHNGLLLVSSLDYLFDIGLITFRDNCYIEISPRLSEKRFHLFGLNRDLKLRKMPQKTPAFLEHHRKYVYRP